MTGNLMPIWVGDHVRWWPDGKDAGKPRLDRYIDGVVERWAAPHPMIRATASHGFAERCMGGWLVPAVGALMDTSVSPGTIERLPRPYAPGEKMTDRHPDSVIAQVVEETIEKHNLDRAKFLATPIEEHWRRFDREFPRVEIKIGDRVRWWPHVTALGTPAVDARYSDGVMVSEDALRIESHGPNGWSSKDGLVGDWRSCAGALVRRLPGDLPLRPRSPYAPLPATPEPAFRLFEQDGALFVDTPSGPVKITTDPTVRPGEVRFVQPATVPPELLEQRDRQMRETYERCGVDPAKLQKSAPAQPGKQWVTPVVYEDRPARPDGFDQRAVDAAKAALLAPAPPRYPRAR